MAERQTAKKSTRKSPNNTSRFTAEEKAAMKERVREQSRAKAGKPDGESEVLAKIATMKGSDRAMAKRVHEIVKASAPELSPRTWYGMPAYGKDGKIVCYFKDAQKFKTRYATLGFSDKANLDEGDMWPTEFAVKEMTTDVEAQIAALVRQAVS